MNQRLYNTSTEHSLLQALGPFRIRSSDAAITAASTVELIEYGQPTTIGDVQHLGQAQLCDDDPQPTEDQLHASD